MIWRKHSKEEISDRIFNAINENVSFSDQIILGVPASSLDDKVFSRNASFLKESPFLSLLVENPNHIGCHTFGSSEDFFSGSQKIEKDVIRICSENIFHAEENSCDGYVASGGTEANLEAIWIYRNFFKTEYNADNTEIAILCSQDSHYSTDKASNLLNIKIFKVSVSENEREIDLGLLNETVEKAKSQGINYFIVVVNMMTTMFGSVDDLNVFLTVLKKHDLTYKIHIDGAYGGFYYPFSNSSNAMDFRNPEISSVTLDAHKMVQAPYGTGIFMIRKGFMQYAQTKAASYVEGEDCTIIGSRSGANAVSIWMILTVYGPHGWFEKILVLQRRTDWLCEQLTQLNIRYYRNKFSNIVTIHASGIPSFLAEKYHLVPDKHNNPTWFKIVVMEHVSVEKLEIFLDEIRNLVH